ncbi:MAG TPA: phage terminase large subunit [Blastocatellia bacterium]|nr:phage terminase large subunit [Blastocatellia bacterium]
MNPSNPLLLSATQAAIRRKAEAEAADPALFARRAGVDLDPWQCDALRIKARRMILLCSRQAGKSSVTAWVSLHTAVYQPSSLILVLAPALRQSQELFFKIKSAINNIGAALPTPITEESALRLAFANGSRIICLPGKTDATIRGFSGVALLVIDEAARVSDEIFAAISPMLAVSQGRMILLSTPWGRRGFFWQMWSEGGSEWHRVKVTARECPRISPAWLEAENRAIGAHWFASEYECEFIDALDQVFATDDIEAAFSDDTIQPLFL